jgi:hypothetical protein
MEFKESFAPYSSANLLSNAEYHQDGGTGGGGGGGKNNNLEGF